METQKDNAERGYTSSTSSNVPAKDWSEITDSEKIERMRIIIKSLQKYQQMYGESIHQLRTKLSKHQHIDGKVVEIKNIEEYDVQSTALGILGGSIISSNSDNLFF